MLCYYIYGFFYFYIGLKYIGLCIIYYVKGQMKINHPDIKYKALVEV